MHVLVESVSEVDDAQTALAAAATAAADFNDTRYTLRPTTSPK